MFAFFAIARQERGAYLSLRSELQAITKSLRAMKLAQPDAIATHNPLRPHIAEPENLSTLRALEAHLQKTDKVLNSFGWTYEQIDTFPVIKAYRAGRTMDGGSCLDGLYVHDEQLGKLIALPLWGDSRRRENVFEKRRTL